MVNMLKIFVVMAGGGLGAASRYLVSHVSQRIWGAGYPAGTLLVNLLGCLFIGISFGLVERSSWFSPEIRLFVITGFLGGLTTFSAFAFETVNAVRIGAYTQAMVHVAINNVLGFLLVIAGMMLTRGLIRL